MIATTRIRYCASQEPGPAMGIGIATEVLTSCPACERVSR
jgi:hypothetical protein